MENWEMWTKEELEAQMSPSKWSPTKSADEVISQHISVCSYETQKARQEIPHKLDISYGASEEQKYDLYGTDLPDNAPIVFWIHGGYWQEGSKNMSATITQNLHKSGIKTIVFGYTLAPIASVRQIQAEFYSALTQVMHEHNKANIIIAGHSAGAQVAVSLLHENCSQNEQPKPDMSRISKFILFAGVYDLRPLVQTYVNGALKLTRHEAELLSPLLQPFRNLGISNNDISLLLCVGMFDSPEFVRQTQAYCSKLSTHFQNVHLWISSQDDHFTLVERLSGPIDDASPIKSVFNFLL